MARSTLVTDRRQANVLARAAEVAAGEVPDGYEDVADWWETTTRWYKKEFANPAFAAEVQSVLDSTDAFKQAGFAADAAAEAQKEAEEFLAQYTGSFQFLVSLRSQVLAARKPLTKKQIDAVLKCKARERAPITVVTVPGSAKDIADSAVGNRDDDDSRVKDPGIYEMDGEFYKVVLTRDKQRLYAKRLVRTGVSRVTESGEAADWEFEYARGALFKLKPEMRVGEERAKEIGLKYGKCINCGKRLKVKKSVEAGIGPVCIKWFRW